jgi:hypothetical protein
MKKVTVTVTADIINAANAIELSSKLEIPTVNTKGNERTGSEQAKYLKGKLKNNPMTFETTEKSKNALNGGMDQRQGKMTKTSRARQMILENNGELNKSEMVKKIMNELNFTYSLAYTYYTHNVQRLVASGQLELDEEISTVDENGNERTPEEQKAYLKELAKKHLAAERSVNGGMDTRHGKATKSSRARELIIAKDAELGKSGMIKLLKEELGFTYSLAHTYYTKNRARLIESGQLVETKAAAEA